MDILFEDARFGKECNKFALLQRKYGSGQAKRIQQRLHDLDAADTLHDLRNLPGRCHELHGKSAGCFSLDLEHPYRLVFRPADPDGCEKADGGIDWSRVTAVSVVGVKDTHEPDAKQ